MSITKTLLLVVTLYATSSSVNAEPVPLEPAPDFTGLTTKGEQIRLSDFRGKPVVLEWTNHECPYVVKHYRSGNMQRSQRTLTEAGAVWISIISSAEGKQGYVTADEADQLTTSRGAYTDHVVLDTDGKIGRLYAARTTPQMFLVNANGKLEYMGAIDNKPSTRLETVEGATNYLLAAWQELEAGNPVSVRSSKPYGCSVKYAGS